MLHGKKLKNSEQVSKRSFQGPLGSNLPSIKIKKDINNKMSIIDLVSLSKLEKSKSEIKIN